MRWGHMPNSNSTNGYCLVYGSYQLRNSGSVVRVDDCVIDETSGYGACDTIPFCAGATNLNLGESKQFDITSYLQSKYEVKNISYNPYEFSEKENKAALDSVLSKSVDTVTSFSILNVIEDKSERMEHISLAHQALRENGVAFFKVFRRNNSGEPSFGETNAGRWYQANKSASCFFGEVCEVFGSDHTFLAKDDIGNTIVAIKK